MTKRAGDKKLAGPGGEARAAVDAFDLPAPTPGFRRRAWLTFQRALDPLGPPRKLPTVPQRPPADD
jgi:hypothetical protein